MNAPQYKPGGAEWHKVEAIIQACSVSRLRAVSALKSCNNDQDAAIQSLDEALLISKPMKHLALGGKTDEIEQPDNGNTYAGPARVPTPTTNPPPPASTSKTTELPSPTKLGGVKKDPPSTELESNRPSTPPPGHQDFEKEQFGPQPAKHIFFNEDFSTHWTSNTSKTRTSVKPKQPKKPPQKPEDAPILFEKSSPLYTTASSTRNAPLAEGQWNLKLPQIELDPTEPEFTAEEGLTQGFSIRRLVYAMQGGMKRGMLQHYLAFFSETVVSGGMNVPLAGFPAIFYAVATNDDKIVRTWVNNGGDVNAIDETYKIPVLAFAIMMADTLGKHTTAVTTTLLSLGADVSVIPRAFFLPYMDDPPNKAPFNHRFTEFNEPSKQWCVDYMRPVLARTINLTQRYFLARTLTERRPSERQTQVAITNGALALLGIGYFMVGQSSAAKMVIQKSLSSMALPKSQPLVMVFSGPSGHGKTELAKRMGELLSLELECIDCTELRYETDLFGPKKPYIGHELGSPLNNFLTRLSGRRCIVFLDEFEKTTADVQNALLIPFDEGKYTDRRNRQAVDCSKTIWIMATNALDDTILDFCDLHQGQVHQTEDSHRHAELMNELSGKLKKQLKSTFGNPLSGRVSLVVPFLPFSAGEQAVVAHKYVLDLTEKVRQSIQVSGQQLVGRIILDVRQDGAICKLIAHEGYDASQGARSLKAAVETRIEDELVIRYLEEDGRIEDWQPMVRYTVDLSRNGVLSVFKTVE